MPAHPSDRSYHFVVGCLVVVSHFFIAESFAQEPYPWQGQPNEPVTSAQLFEQYDTLDSVDQPLTFRTRMEDRGISFSGNVGQIYQGVTSGGLNQVFHYGGHNDYIFNFDMGKLIGAEGLSIKLRGETQFGSFVNDDSGAIIPVTTFGVTPTPERGSGVTNLVATQMLSDKTGVMFGKIDTFDGDQNAYASGRGKTQFSNMALVANAITFRTTPYSTWGTGFFILGDEPDPLFSVAVIDPRDFGTEFNIDEMYSEGVTVSSEMRLPTNWRGRPGHQLFGGTWSNAEFSDLDDIGRLLLGGVGPLEQRDDSWSVYWNFDQQLFSIPCVGDEEKGWGVFGRAGYADRHTNPIEWLVSFGVGGDSPIAGRHNDRFGIGWVYMRTSSEIPSTALQSHGQAVEAFYNYAVSERIYVSPDIQVIDASRIGTNTALLAGVRMVVEF